MAKLAEGNRVYDAVANVAVLASELNDLQDQLKAMLGPQTVDVIGLCAASTTAPAEWEWDTTTNVWRCTVAYTNQFHLPLRAGQKVTGVYIAASRSGAASASGHLAIYKQSCTPAGGAMPAAVLIGQLVEPWNTGADGDTEKRAVNDDGSGGLGVAGAAFAAFAIEADYKYYIQIQGIAARTILIAAVMVTAQFGN